MAQAYFSLVTTLGRNKLAASAAGGPEIVITHFAVGDGNGAETNPVAANTALVREVWRTPIESVVVDPDNPSAVLVTAIIPTTAGGWYMREFGVFDQAGTMIAIAKPVSQYKPTALEGQLEDIRYEFQIIIGETANVTMLVDPSVLLASRDWVSNRRISMGQLMRLPWVPVISMTITAPPASPSVGDTYAIPTAATGAWAGHAQELAEWTGTGWTIINPPDGHGISLPDGRVFLQIAGAYVEKLALDAQGGKWNYAVAGGTANALTATLVPAPAALANGFEANILIGADNTGPATLNAAGLGAAAILRSDGTALDAGDLKAGKISSLIYLAGSWYLPTLPIKAFSSFRAQQSNQLVPSNANTLITTWPSVVTNFVDSTFVAGVFTVGSKDAGLWQLNAAANYALQSGMVANIQKNGITVCETSIPAACTSVACATMIQLVAGDVLQMLTGQLSGAAALMSGSQAVSFSGFRVSK